MSTSKLQVIPLGGLGEFGMNCMALRWGNDIIVVDAGLIEFDGTVLMKDGKPSANMFAAGEIMAGNVLVFRKKPSASAPAAP